MGRSISEVAAEIRDHVLNRRYPGNQLPSERTIASQCNASRQTVRLALEVLKSEGIVINVPGGRWEITDSDRDATFASFDGFLEVVSRELRPAHVRDLLEFRRREFVTGVDARLLEGAQVPSSARKILEALPNLSRAGSVLEAEDELMTCLMVGGQSVIELFAAQQLRRAMAKVRTLIDLDFGLYPDVPGFKELIAAWTAGDRPKTLLLADRVATERETLYVRLMRNAAAAPSFASDSTQPGTH